MKWELALIAAVIGALPVAPAMAQAQDDAPQTISGISAPHMFEIAERALAAGDIAAAETIYVALAKDPDIDIRSEARFRHSRLMSAQKRYSEAGVLLRAILDEKPDAQPVRLELAAVLAMMGDTGGARREIRQAQAGGLPPEVAALVDQYSAALRSLKPFGMSFELALAPSTNINRATTSTTLDTIIAPFELSDDARAKSGIGIKSGGQAYVKLPIGKGAQATARLSGQSTLYRQGAFNDAVASGQVGLDAIVGKVRLRPQIGRSYRWFGGNLYASTDTISLSGMRAVGKQTQVEAEAGIGFANYRTNDLQDGRIYDASITVEHAFSQRMGGSFSLTGQRQAATDPGYSTKTVGFSALLYREMGKATVYANAGLSRLEADERLFLYPEKRKEWLYRAGIGATLRQFTWREFAPIIRASYERNDSTIGIYDYNRFALEIGITRAF